MGLFNLSYEELCENFVRAKFAESTAFNDADVEKKLREQYNAEQPDSDFWYGCRVQLARRILKDSAGRILLEHAMPTSRSDKDLDKWVDERLSQSKMGPLWQFLMVNHAKAYMTDDFPVFVLETEGGTVCYIIASDGSPTAPIGLIIVDALLRCWEHDRYGISRQYLCDLLSTLIAAVRAEAKSDFDRAVAVSEDGKRIVHADWVAVLQCDYVIRGDTDLREVIVYRGDAFRTNKIKREFHLCRTHMSHLYQIEFYGPLHHPERQPIDAKFIASHVRLIVLRQQSPQVFFDAEKSDGNNNILYTFRNFCPSPLPEGGEVIELS